jgi:Zn-dependent protease with chaperone function
MLKQQIIGVLNLSTYIVILFWLCPALFLSQYSILVISLIMGLYIWYLNKKSLTNMVAGLTFKPTGMHKELLEHQIVSCQLNPDDVHLFYAYTNESLALTASNNIILDPIVCDSIKEDPQAIAVINIFETHIKPSLSELQKTRIAKSRELLSEKAQSFIFKHELGHVARNYSRNKLIIVFIIGALSTYFGIISALYILPFNGWLAALIGATVGGISDLFLSYLCNGTFKVYEETQADIFASKFSSNEEIEAAADFFEHYEDVTQKYSDPSLIQKLIPITFSAGYLDGKTRATLLRSLVKK